jgi:nitrate/nitrite transporter NarK
MIALAGQRFPAARGVAAGFTAGAGALGGFAIPWLTGAIGDWAGIDLALSSLVLWSIAIAAAGLAAQRGHTAAISRRPEASIE